MAMIAVNEVTEIRLVDERNEGASSQTRAANTTTTAASVASREARQSAHQYAGCAAG